jgi:hypothetical protein
MACGRRCRESIHRRCTCSCGGKYHGKRSGELSGFPVDHEQQRRKKREDTSGQGTLFFGPGRLDPVAEMMEVKDER